MAASGAMADFARMPNQRKALIFIVAGLVLLGGYYKLVYKSLDDDLEAAQGEHNNKVATSKKLSEDLPKYEDLRLHMTKLRELIEKNQTALPSEAEVPAFFETLQHKVNESGVEINKWTNRQEEPVESFVKVPVDVEMTGTFMQIKRFFASLIQKDVQPADTADDQAAQDHERIVSIENLSLSSPTVRNREIVLTAKFTAVTFRQEDKPAAPANGQPGQPAGAPSAPSAMPPPSAPLPSAPPSAPLPTPGSGAPAAAPSTPPSLPSAATPAGAKARVENAIEKGDARNRKAAGANDAKAGSDRLKGGL